MSMKPRKSNIVERFLFGPSANKGLFQLDPWQQLTQNAWQLPDAPMNPRATYGGRINYAVEAGDLIDNSAFMACMLWIQRTFPEAPLVVKRAQPDGTDKIDPKHTMTRIVLRPNDFYSGKLLWQATLFSFNWNGNAYWRKVRNGMGQVIQLWYEPHWTCRPIRRSSDEFISKYQIWRNEGAGWTGTWQDVDVNDIVHFRYGIDPRNQMLGLSPIASALRDVFTDNEAARYAAVMFRNMGVIGGLVSSGSDELPIENPVALKAELQQLTTGDERGKWIVQDVPLKLEQMNNDPSKMDTRSNRKISEERISALLGVPAIVAGLGAGLDRSTFANMAEAREAAYEGNIIPTQAMLADELDIQLLPEFGDNETEHSDWDYTKVRVLQEDENKKAAKWAILFNAGIVKRSTVLADLGIPYDEVTDGIYKTDIAQLRASLEAPPPDQEAEIVAAEPKRVVVADTTPVDVTPAKELLGHTNGNGAY